MSMTHIGRYLSCVWQRTIPVCYHEDCTQEVLAIYLERMGRTRLESLINNPKIVDEDFYRVIDTVKKRVQREHKHRSLLSDVFTTADPQTHELYDAITFLTPREQCLINDVLAGFSLAEIGARSGVSAKTASDRKSRTLRKLRSILTGCVDPAILVHGRGWSTVNY